MQFSLVSSYLHNLIYKNFMESFRQTSYQLAATKCNCLFRADRAVSLASSSYNHEDTADQTKYAGTHGQCIGVMEIVNSVVSNGPSKNDVIVSFSTEDGNSNKPANHRDDQQASRRQTDFTVPSAVSLEHVEDDEEIADILTHEAHTCKCLNDSCSRVPNSIILAGSCEVSCSP